MASLLDAAAKAGALPAGELLAPAFAHQRHVRPAMQRFRNLEGEDTCACMRKPTSPVRKPSSPAFKITNMLKTTHYKSLRSGSVGHDRPHRP